MEESNKLIAEFMGIHEIMRDNKLIANFMFEETMPINQMRYHSSWDWLMPVANEIIKSRDEQNADWDLNDLKYALCTTNIEYVYKAVVEFIMHDEYSEYDFADNTLDVVHQDELKYHLSWDWLMPVIEKIKILVMEDDSDELYNSEEWDNITHTLVQIEIKSVYQAVVEFIKDQNN